MKYRILFSCLSLLFISVKGFSQSKEFKYYFDKNLKPIEKAEAAFTGTGTYYGAGIELKLYDASDKNLVSTGHFTDSSLQVKDGLFQSYYSNASLKSEKTYLKGTEDGLWKEWDSFGNIIDSSIYENGRKVIGGMFYYYQNHNVKRVFIVDTKKDKGYHILYGVNFDENGRVTGRDTLKESIDGKIFTKTEIEPSFPGGEVACTNYISKVLQQNMNNLTNDNMNIGTCRIKFLVDWDGNVTNVESLNMRGSALARISVEAIAKGPKWIPAKQNGYFVTAFKTQYITFPIQKRE